MHRRERARKDGSRLLASLAGTDNQLQGTPSVIQHQLCPPCRGASSSWAGSSPQPDHQPSTFHPHPRLPPLQQSCWLGASNRAQVRPPLLSCPPALAMGAVLAVINSWISSAFQFLCNESSVFNTICWKYLVWFCFPEWTGIFFGDPKRECSEQVRI